MKSVTLGRVIPLLEVAVADAAERVYRAPDVTTGAFKAKAESRLQTKGR